ncbi:MAG: ABC transporter ATP-binding protein [Spirochaetales bacterium]|nr:ABC transporter ATP-binding protein [Spirochaetales bacterium]
MEQDNELQVEEPVLEIRNLSISFQTTRGELNAIRGVNFKLCKGETMAIVGESGSGKSVTVKSIMGIRSSNQIINSGEIIYRHNENGCKEEIDLLKLSKKQMISRINGKRIAMVFQDPMTALNPLFTIGQQLTEGMKLHLKLGKAEAWRRGIELLDEVGITDPEGCMKRYPHQLSGGMRQRVVIAIAISCNPDILICDEPTTALDVTIQAKIIELIAQLQKKMNISIIYITHDLGVVAKVADYVAVMYAGKIVERGTAHEIYFQPRHPYTWGLLLSMPDLETSDDRLYTIPGSPPNLLHKVKGDAFSVRNSYALNIDFEEDPPVFNISNTHEVSSWLEHPDAPKTEIPDLLQKKIDKMLKNSQKEGFEDALLLQA